MKLSVGFNHGTHIPEFVALSDGQENDMFERRKFDFPNGSIVAFDKLIRFKFQQIQIELLMPKAGI